MSESQTRPRVEVPGVSAPMPAPGALETVQAFVNTAATGKQPDGLASPAALSRWLARRGLLKANIEISESDLAWALEVRKALHALLAAKTWGELAPESAAVLEQMAGCARCGLKFDDGGPAGFIARGSDLEDALGVILAAFVVSRSTAWWPHFRLCASPDCRRAFYDGSRSRTGRWCTPRCGSRARSATFRRRRGTR